MVSFSTIVEEISTPAMFNVSSKQKPDIQGARQPGQLELLPARREGRQQGDPGGQRPGGDRVGQRRPLRRHDHHRAAHRDRILDVLQGVYSQPSMYDAVLRQT